MSYLDFIAVSHGFLGVMILMGIGGVLTSLWLLPKKNINAAKAFSLLATVSTFLTVLFGDALYVLYKSPNNAKAILKAGENKWLHSIGMEFKEHAGHFIPIMLLVTTIIVWYYGDELIKNKCLRRSALAFLILALAYTFIEMAWGTLITGVQPVT